MNKTNRTKVANATAALGSLVPSVVNNSDLHVDIRRDTLHIATGPDLICDVDIASASAAIHAPGSYVCWARDYASGSMHYAGIKTTDEVRVWLLDIILAHAAKAAA